MASKRKPDINGWYEIKENPLSKVGVFPYKGSTIDYKGEFGLDPDKIYNVLRSKEELSDPETIDSFKLVPWINDHVMLGTKPGYMKAEEKGVSGVIGEDVFFDDKDQMLKGNVKVFSEGLKDDIDEGKEELSLGYHCNYIRKNGILGGIGHEFSQVCIRGNHMASVDEGRMGPEIAVLDGNLMGFTIDSKELVKMAMTPEEMEEFLLELAGTVKTLNEKIDGLTPKAEDMEEDPDKKAEDMEEDPDKKAEDMEEDPDKKAEDMEENPDKKAEDAEGMDSLKKTIKDLTSTVDGLKKNAVKTVMSEISKRNSLAENLSHHIGTFDHAEKTLDEVAKYGVEKLELKCEKGSELATLNGFFHGKNLTTTVDSKQVESMDSIDDYVNGKAKKE